jgi:hypothetical protein
MVWMSSMRVTALSAYASRKPDPPEGALAVHGDVIPRQSHHAVSHQLEIGVAVRVELAVAAGSVELEAVELDRETLLWPEGIDFVGGCFSAYCSIEGWTRYVGGGLQELLETPFELALLGAGFVGGDRFSERTCSAAPVRAVEELVIAVRSKRPSRSARSMATTSSCGLTTALRSRRVRAGVVTGMPSSTVKSCGASIRVL